jgi:hypothetical protein
MYKGNIHEKQGARTDFTKSIDNICTDNFYFIFQTLLAYHLRIKIINTFAFVLALHF